MWWGRRKTIQKWENKRKRSLRKIRNHCTKNAVSIKSEITVQNMKKITAGLRVRGCAGAQTRLRVQNTCTHTVRSACVSSDLNPSSKNASGFGWPYSVFVSADLDYFGCDRLENDDLEFWEPNPRTRKARFILWKNRCDMRHVAAAALRHATAMADLYYFVASPVKL